MDFFTTSFWQSFLSNALATFLGAVIGIPIALLLNKYQEKASEFERKRKILSLLKEELLINLTQISAWNKNPNKHIETNVIGPFLRNESWKAFSDGGELKWIKNPILLSELARAYSHIRTLQELSERYINLFYIAHDENTRTTAIKLIWEMIEKEIIETIEMINLALLAISKEKVDN
jgi:hypothetical protein